MNNVAKTFLTGAIAIVLGALFAHIGIVWLAMALAFTGAMAFNLGVQPKFNIWIDSIVALACSLIAWVALLI